jgi:hypothetical protein
MTNINWKTAANGSWSVNANWNPAGPPTNDDVFVTNAALAGFTSTIDTAFTIHSLGVNSSQATVMQSASAPLTVTTNINLAAGLLSLNATNSIGGKVNVSGGELDVGIGGALGAAQVSLSGGMLLATSSETIGNYVGESGASTTIAAAHGTTLTMTGGVDFDTDGTLLKFGAAGQDGTIVVQTKGALIATGFVNDQYEFAAGTVVADGTIAFINNANVSSTTIDAGATLDVNQFGFVFKSLNGAGTLTNSGTPTIATIQSGNFSGTISGQFSLNLGATNGSVVTLSGTSNYLGPTNIVAGEVIMGSTLAIGVGRLTLNNNTVLLANVSKNFINTFNISDHAATTIAAATGSTVNLTGAINFIGSSDTLTLGSLGVGHTGAVNLANAAVIHGFTAGDSIDLAGQAWAAGEHLAWLSTTNNVETFAVEDASNNILTKLNFAGAYAGRSFFLSNDGSGGALITGGLAPLGTGNAHDLNGDATSDVVLQSGGAVVDWIVSDGYAVAGHVIGSNLTGWNVVGSGDVTGDGTADVLLQNGDTVVNWTMHNGLVQAGALVGSAGGYTVAGIGDFNGDGVADLVLQNNGSFVDWIMQGGVAVAGNGLGSGLTGWSVAGTGDFNGDGVTDILLQNNGSVVVWDMGNGAVSNGALVATVPGWSVVGTGDFNGDGTTDVLVENGATFGDWIMHNNAIAWSNVLSSSLFGWTAVACGDYNGDGVSDILMQNGTGTGDFQMQNGVIATSFVTGLTGSYIVKA